MVPAATCSPASSSAHPPRAPAPRSAAADAECGENRGGEQELQPCWEFDPSGASRGREELPSARAKERKDVFEVRRGAATAPSVAGSSGPRRVARRRMPAVALPISNRRERKSRCGTRSPATWRTGPRRSAEPRAAGRPDRSACRHVEGNYHGCLTSRMPAPPPRRRLGLRRPSLDVEMHELQRVFERQVRQLAKP